MTSIDIIMSIEATNVNAIYLYEHGGKWWAYEHSAYHFSLLFDMGEIEQVDGRICIVIDNRLAFMHSKSMRSVHVASVSDSEVKIECLDAFTGFQKWKQLHIN